MLKMELDKNVIPFRSSSYLDSKQFLHLENKHCMHTSNIMKSSLTTVYEDKSNEF